MISFVLVLLLGPAIHGRVSPSHGSPRDVAQLYRAYTAQYRADHRLMGSTEQRARFNIFRQSLKFMEKQNQADLTWRSGLNRFSDMTEEERRSFEGVNMTQVPLESSNTVDDSGLKGSYQYPESKMWLGSVFDPVDQGNCGSCWIFGSLTAIEGRYHQLTGKLKRFSQQQMLDCVFAWRDDKGCGGGANYCTYHYIAKGNPLTASSKYPSYVAKEGSCKQDRYPDGLQAAKITGYVNTHPSEEGLLVALSQGVTAVSFQTTNAFYAYESGVIRDETCSLTATTHAVAAVGYSPAYILVKNSWGEDWGESGFVKFSRKHHSCLLHSKPIYPVMTITGVRDGDESERATSYRPSEEKDAVETPCKDNHPSWFCGRGTCGNWENAVDCAKTCGRCSQDAGSCPRGEVMCASATCKKSC